MGNSVSRLENLSRLGGVGSFQSNHHRNFETNFPARFHKGIGDQIALGDAAEDVDQNPLHLRIGQDNPEGFACAFRSNAAADIEKVCRLPAMMFDDAHRSHRQPGTVHKAADVAVELNEVEVRLGLARISTGFSSVRSRSS